MSFYSPQGSSPVETVTFLTDGAVFEISRTSLSNVTLDTIPTDSRGSYVLDGDADCVSAILNYYRTGQLHIPQVSMSVCSGGSNRGTRAAAPSPVFCQFHAVFWGAGNTKIVSLDIVDRWILNLSSSTFLLLASLFVQITNYRF